MAECQIIIRPFSAKGISKGYLKVLAFCKQGADKVRKRFRVAGK
jgi:hypothetical protein